MAAEKLHPLVIGVQFQANEGSHRARRKMSGNSLVKVPYPTEFLSSLVEIIIRECGKCEIYAFCPQSAVDGALV